jgi:hypothetical protein
MFAGWLEVPERWTVHRKVVVVKYRDPILQDAVQGLAKGLVEWERNDVLDNDEVEVLQCAGERFFKLGWLVVHPHPRNQEIGLAPASDGLHLMSKGRECVLPLLGLNGNTVGAT